MKIKTVDLLVWHENSNSISPIQWPLGKVHTLVPTPLTAQKGLSEYLASTKAEFILFWDPQLGMPDADVIGELVNEPMDVWHAGLKLGTGSFPCIINYVSPTWTLNVDPSPEIRAMSWRLSLRACLIRIKVLIELGQIDSAFTSLDMAGLEMGYRYIWRGAMIVHEPRLVSGNHIQYQYIHDEDSFIFIGRHFRTAWQKYVLARRILSNGKLRKEFSAYKRARKQITNFPPQVSAGQALIHKAQKIEQKNGDFISVLIPTICRYPYLRKTLQLLNSQTVVPNEVVIVDQTPLLERKPELYDMFPELNLKVIWMDEPGQCSARNAGLSILRGNLILFLDDDILIGNDYIESLLEAKSLFKVDIVQGVWDQSTGQATSVMDRHFRMSDRFASGNGMASRAALEKVHGFDLRYNRNYRADADIGMRLYLSGAMSVIVPDAKEHSLSPATGGLKFFGATGALRQIRLFQPWPPVTQVYYWLRYFSPSQVTEAYILQFLTMFFPNNFDHLDSIMSKILFLIKNSFKFPFRILGAIESKRKAEQLIKDGPIIST